MLGMQTQPRVHQKMGEVKQNPIGIEQRQAGQISDGLNVLLASVYTLYHQIKKHHWVVEGPNFRDLHLMLDELAGHLLTFADQLAERLTVLGGYPVSTPRMQQEMCVFPVEEEGVFDLRFMLENDLRAYQEVIVRFRDCIRMALGANDFGTHGLLKNQLQELEFDAHHLEHVLGEDTLILR